MTHDIGGLPSVGFSHISGGKTKDRDTPSRAEQVLRNSASIMTALDKRMYFDTSSERRLPDLPYAGWTSPRSGRCSFGPCFFPIANAADQALGKLSCTIA